MDKDVELKSSWTCDEEDYSPKILIVKNDENDNSETSLPSNGLRFRCPNDDAKSLPFKISISMKRGSLHSHRGISSLDILCNARFMEVYKGDGEYRCTEDGIYLQTIQPATRLYILQHSFHGPVIKATFKFVGLQNKDEIFVHSMHVCLGAAPQMTPDNPLSLGPMLDMEKVKALLPSSGESLPPGAQNLLHSIENFQQSKAQTSMQGAGGMAMLMSLFSSMPKSTSKPTSSSATKRRSSATKATTSQTTKTQGQHSQNSGRNQEHAREKLKPDSSANATGLGISHTEIKSSSSIEENTRDAGKNELETNMARDAGKNELGTNMARDAGNNELGTNMARDAGNNELGTNMARDAGNNELGTNMARDAGNNELGTNMAHDAGNNELGTNMARDADESKTDVVETQINIAMLTDENKTNSVRCSPPISGLDNSDNARCNDDIIRDKNCTTGSGNFGVENKSFTDPISEDVSDINSLMESCSLTSSQSKLKTEELCSTDVSLPTSITQSLPGVADADVKQFITQSVNEVEEKLKHYISQEISQLESRLNNKLDTILNLLQSHHAGQCTKWDNNLEFSLD